MIYEASKLAVGIFVAFVIFVLGFSSYLAKRSKSAEGYFTAGGTIHWAINGIAFAGDYLSAASFLGICALIATKGYDGFLYSVGYLSGWIVALFVVAEPMKRLGKYTFTDALDYKFNSKAIQLMAAISTLVVSIFYLIPQMVGAGALVKPLLGLEHWHGVVIVGTIVIFIVATAGMTSTTYVQFLKGGLLIVFSTILTICLLKAGLTTDLKENPNRIFKKYITIDAEIQGGKIISASNGYTIKSQINHKIKEHTYTFLQLEKAGISNWWHLTKENKLVECLSIMDTGTEKLYNGKPKTKKAVDQAFYQVGHLVEIGGKKRVSTGGLWPIAWLKTLQDATFVSYKKMKFKDGENKITAFFPVIVSGKAMTTSGRKFPVKTTLQKFDFLSLMLALFFGTAALPHILIRYYTVPSPRDARKSTIVAIACIGFFYILTLFMGFGAATHGVIDMTGTNMSAPLLAKVFGITLFSIISAIAFATVLGTVSGLIVAASGAIAHDLADNYFDIKMDDKQKVKIGKIAAVVVGIIAIILGILFKGMNVAFLVGWAFAVAASANLPAILMLLFWKKTTAKGIAYSILVGIIAAMAIILVSPDMFEKYGWARDAAPLGLKNPGIISIPLSFITLVVVSLFTQKDNKNLPVNN